MIDFICKECGKRFKSYPSRVGIKKYCSNHCRGLNTPNLFKKSNDINIGRKFSMETKKKISLSQIGKRKPNGSKAKMGSKNPNWKGGISPINKRIRRSAKFFQWRKKVFERDNYTCQECGKRGNELHPDHIKQFAYYPELRFELSNGRTLCKECHLKTKTFGFKKHQLPEKQI